MKKEQPQRLSTEEWAAKKQEERARLYDMAADMADKVFSDSVNLKKYLDVQARLGKASVNNALLAAEQKPEVSYLLSYEDWQDKGRVVKRGEKAVMQLVANGEYERQDGSMGVSMDAKRVFDVSQTYRASDKRQAARLPCRTERGRGRNVFPAGQTTCRKRRRFRSSESGKSNAVGTEDEPYPKPRRRSSLQRSDLHLIPIPQRKAAVTDGGFSFSGSVQEVIKSHE